MKSNNAGDYFDDVKYGGNYIKEYWPSHTPAKERPWVFVPPGGSQTTNLSVRNKKNKNAGKEAYQVMKVQTSGGGSSISPSTFIGDDSNFNIGQSMHTSGSYPFVGSCSKDTIAYIYSQAGKSYGLNLKLIAFSHDDVRIKFGKVASDTTLCISSGADGYYTGAINKPSYYNVNDSLIYGKINGQSYIKSIVAGNDSICNSGVPPSPYIYYNTVPNYINWLMECNSLYNQIGVNFSILNYDTIIMPEFFKPNHELEASEFNILADLNPLNYPNEIDVYFTKIIYNSTPGDITYGRAREIGTPILSMAGIANGFTLGHEIGHAKFWLRHPDNDSNHLIPSVLEGETSPGVGPYNYSDKNNFMYHTSVGRVNRIRQYQWKKILTGKYGN